MKISKIALSTLGVLAFCAIAAAHNHVTIDTASGTPKPVTVIRAGYLPAEAAFSIVNGRLIQGDSFAVYLTPDVFLSGTLAGWHAGNELVLTSDYYFATGRLDGGDFRYELANLTPVSGPRGTFVWGSFGDSGEFTPLARTDASTREGRSFAVGVGGHDHDQAYAFTGGWVQDLTLIGWDANNVFAESLSVTVRFDSGECPADVNRQGGVSVQDIFDFLADWFAGSASSDFNHSGQTSVQDIFDFLAAWFAGCA